MAAETLRAQDQAAQQTRAEQAVVGPQPAADGARRLGTWAPAIALALCGMGLIVRAARVHPMRPPRCRTSPRRVSVRPSGPARPHSGPPASPTGMQCRFPAQSHPSPTCPRGPCGRPRPRPTPSLAATGCSIGWARAECPRCSSRWGRAEGFRATSSSSGCGPNWPATGRPSPSSSRGPHPGGPGALEHRAGVRLRHHRRRVLHVEEYIVGRDLARVSTRCVERTGFRWSPEWSTTSLRDAAGAGLRPRQEGRDGGPWASSTGTSRPATSCCPRRAR